MANIERLEQLRRVVRDTPDRLFDMRYLDTRSAPGVPQCVISWARADPWFRVNAGGLRVGFRVGGVACMNFFKAAALFGITAFDAVRLFEPATATGARVTRDDVISNIDRLIAGKRAVRYGAR